MISAGSLGGGERIILEIFARMRFLLLVARIFLGREPFSRGGKSFERGSLQGGNLYLKWVRIF